ADRSRSARASGSSTAGSDSRATRDSRARTAGADRLRTTKPSRRRLESGLDRLTGLVIADVLVIPRRAQRDRIVEAAREAEHQLRRFRPGVRAGRRARHAVDVAAAYRVLPKQRALVAPHEQPDVAACRDAEIVAVVEYARDPVRLDSVRVAELLERRDLV